MFNRAITYNLGYALNHSPPALEERDDEERAQLTEAEAAGSTDWFDESFSTIWTDFGLLGVDSWPDAVPQMMDVLNVVGVVETVADRSKMEKFDAVEWEQKLNREGFAAELLHARKLTRERIENRGLGHLVSGFDRSMINPWSTYAENILFGVTIIGGFTTRDMAQSEVLRGGLQQGELYDSAVAVGSAAVSALLMLHHNLPSDHELVVRFSLDDPDQIEEIGRAADWLAGEPSAAQREQAEIIMISVFLNIVPGTFNLVVIPDDIEQKVLVTRELSLAYTRQMSLENFREFDQSAYNPGLSVFDNFIFGRINHREPDAYSRLRAIVDEVVREVDLYELLMILFFANSESGIGGSRLPEGARHRIALARTLLKRPDIIVLHDALPRYSKRDRQVVIERIRAHLPQSAIVSLSDSASADEGFVDRYVLDESGLRPEQTGVLPASTSQAAASSDQSLLSVMGNVVELAALSEAQKTMLSLESQTIHVSPGDVIYDVGDEASHAYVLLQGSAQLQSRGADGVTESRDVPSRCLIGDLEVLAKMPRASTLQALDDCEWIQLDGAVLSDALRQNPTLAQDFLQRVAGLAAAREFAG